LRQEHATAAAAAHIKKDPAAAAATLINEACKISDMNTTAFYNLGTH
jgi:hypothetical protein